MADFQDEPAGGLFSTPPIRAEFEHEFDAIGFDKTRASTHKRPDSISFDYLTDTEIGPIELQDPSQGLLARVWRARVVESKLLLAKVNDEGTDYVDEIELIDLGFSDVVEIDLAFTQNGDPVVGIEREPHQLYIYYFDPTIPAFTVQYFGPGRNPRVLLDDPFDIPNSDVQVFYISDTENCVVYRQQRDRYQTEYLTPINGVGARFLEEVYRGTDLRLHLAMLERNVVTGRYNIVVYSTLLFPALLKAEQFTYSPRAYVDLTEIVKKSILDPENFTYAPSIVGIILESINVFYDAIGEIQMDEVTPLFIDLVDIVKESILDPEHFEYVPSIVSVAVDDVLIITTLDVEHFGYVPSVVGVELAVP